MSEKLYKAGLYLRLSKDDERVGESVSIENQRLLLTKYADEQGWEVEDIYIDDGWSGTNFKRPSYQRMIRDIENKKINLVIVKDLSRLGRDYVEMGRLMRDTLPELGCRFVAVNDSVDSEHGENDMAVYRNIFNEMHSKDTSKKVRTVKKACMEQGKYLGTYAPFGYRKNPQNKYHLIIDDETAHIVRKIFTMRSNGKSIRSIALALNAEKIPSPKQIYYNRAERKNPRTENGFWADTTVKMILKNEVYIGNLVQGKYGTVSYKNRKMIVKPEDQWVRIENTHEALIDMQTWKTVRMLESKSYKPRKTSEENTENIFSGLLKCADCGFTMRMSIEKGTRKDGSKSQYISYFCGNYSRSGKSACTAHIIYESALSQLILDDIRRKAQAAVYDERRIINDIIQAKNHENMAALALYKQELKSLEARISEIEQAIKTMYDDRVSGVFTGEMFKNLSKKYEAERKEKIKSVTILRQKIEKSERDSLDIDSWLKTIRKYAELESLSQDILIELVDKIEVFEAERLGGQRICRVKIYYRFVGDLREVEAGDVDEAV